MSLYPTPHRLLLLGLAETDVVLDDHMDSRLDGHRVTSAMHEMEIAGWAEALKVARLLAGGES